ncbi:MAG: hypothetical protein ACP5F6_08550 [Microbacter sp.]
MPYRRLPKTDQARLRSLRALIAQCNEHKDEAVVSYKIQLEADELLRKFENLMRMYHEASERQTERNKEYQLLFQNAKMYLSHFIQVLNMSIQRGEIKPDIKVLYHLPPDPYSMPDFSSVDQLISAGQFIIDGESERMQLGGTPLYNPTIAKVRVHYDLFKEFRFNQLIIQQNTQRYARQMDELRHAVDLMIVNAWDQIEKAFSAMPFLQRIETCQAWGVIYYYRRNEKSSGEAEDEASDEPFHEELLLLAEEQQPLTTNDQADLKEQRLFEEADNEDVAPLAAKENASILKKKKVNDQSSLLSLFN